MGQKQHFKRGNEKERLKTKGRDKPSILKHENPKLCLVKPRLNDLVRKRRGESKLTWRFSGRGSTAFQQHSLHLNLDKPGSHSPKLGKKSV